MLFFVVCVVVCVVLCCVVVLLCCFLLFNCTQTRHSCTSAHLLPVSSDLSDSLDRSPNAFALAQGVPENRVAFDMVAERR